MEHSRGVLHQQERQLYHSRELQYKMASTEDQTLSRILSEPAGLSHFLRKNKIILTVQERLDSGIGVCQNDSAILIRQNEQAINCHSIDSQPCSRR